MAATLRILDSPSIDMKNTSPTISVVMGVYNDIGSLQNAVNSILDQTFSDLELIVIDDGSTDGSTQLLEELMTTDSRLKVIRHENKGLTRSLITGCGVAQGRYIARQDADDVSLPDRLRKQIDALEVNKNAVLATCWVEGVTAEGVVCGRHTDLNHTVRFASGESHHLTGVAAHGSVLMRRDALEAVGGYRSCFYYAQDSDLWLRISELGEFCIVPEVLYRRVVGTDCISSRFRDAQARFCELAQESWRAAKANLSDAQFIEEANQLTNQCRQQKNRKITPKDRATSLMLVGASLTNRDPKLARKYLLQAVQASPLHLRSWKALIYHSIRQLLQSTQESSK